MSDMGDRIRERRKALDLSQEDLGRALRKGQTTVSAWEKGTNAPDRILKILTNLAKVLQTTPEWLLFGRTSHQQAQARLVGYIGQGARVTMVPEDQKKLVMGPPGDNLEQECLEVIGDSNYPVYCHADHVFYDPARSRQPEDLLHQECVVDLVNGDRLVARLLPSPSPGLFTLASCRFPEITDARVARAMKVTWILRAQSPIS